MGAITPGRLARLVCSTAMGIVSVSGLIGINPLQATRADAEDSQWIRPTKSNDPLIWGRKDGVVIGLPSDAGLPGPRGLIRVGVVSAKTGKPELVNFIAIEPVVVGRGSRGDRMAFSELESSELDGGSQGKRLWIADEPTVTSSKSSTDSSPGSKDHEKPIEEMSIRIEVERFAANRAHVYVVATIASDRPEEVRFAVYRYDDGPEIEELTLTATMGNYERLRQLWLKSQIIDSRRLYKSYRGDDFAEHGDYGLKQISRTAHGDAIVFCTSNEKHPEANPDFEAADHWRYGLGRLTQYWRVPSSDIQPNLRVRVNGRRVYWKSQARVGGGVAFENFEIREKYKPGQVFIFGLTVKEPWEIQPSMQRFVEATSSAAN